MKHLFCLIIASLILTNAYADTYTGRVVDSQGAGIGFATVYLQPIPEIGTATNNDGYFSLTCIVDSTTPAIISFLGYEKQELPIGLLRDSFTIVLKEQPVALQEMVVSAKPQKQKNKRKQMQAFLDEVERQMSYDFSAQNASYRIVSDVRMDADSMPWGMEQMIATAVCLPDKGDEGRDSVQFAAQLCKRYFDARIRARADSIYASNQLKDKELRAASAIDSGVVVHRALWKAGNIKYDFKKFKSDWRHWQITNENEGETVLTHTEKHNFLGMFVMEIKRHYILHSSTLEVLRFSEELNGRVSIPFGYRLKGVYLQMLNLLNMDDQSFEKFKIRRARISMKLNTIYQHQDEHIYIKEKNLSADAWIQSTKKDEIPLQIRATQTAVSLNTTDVQPLQRSQMTTRIGREIVEIW